MMAEILVAGRDRTDWDVLNKALEVLRRDGLVVFPTETYYGIAASAASAQALDRLAKLKGRGQGKPVGLIVGEAAMLAGLAAETNALAKQLMEAHWPGPLTMVLNALPGLHKSLVSKDGGIGVRVPSHWLARQLSIGLGAAITATSANPPGGAPAQRVEELDPWLMERVDLVLDGGPTPGGPASTVLDVRSKTPFVIRPGAVDLREISQA